MLTGKRYRFYKNVELMCIISFFILVITTFFLLLELSNEDLQKIKLIDIATTFIAVIIVLFIFSKGKTLEHLEQNEEGKAIEEWNKARIEKQKK